MSLLSSLATAAVFTAMFSLGLLLTRAHLEAALARRMLLAAALFAVVVPVPALAVLFVRLAGVSGPAAAGIVLMSISPGAPIALRRAIDVGGRSFAPALHLAIVILAVVTVPISIVAMNAVFNVSFTISPLEVGRQVLVAQILPLGLGIALRALRPAMADRIEPRLARVSNLLLVALFVTIVALMWTQLSSLAWVPTMGGAVLTSCALAIGSVVGGRDPRARRQAAIAAAMRNPGLALLIATVNQMPSLVAAAVIGYALGAAPVVALYVVWHRRHPTTAG